MPSELDLGRRRFLGTTAMMLASAPFVLGTVNANAREPREFTALGRGEAWLNSVRLSAASLLGKVVLVQFGTYTGSSVLSGPTGRIAYRFHARDLHLVMGPQRQGHSVRFRVSIDGQPPGLAHGLDVDDSGRGVVTEQRLHQLIRQPGAIADRTFEIEFLDSGVEAFAFTFG